jgi:hypothetical protein
MKKNATVVLLLILFIITIQNVAINVYAAGNDDTNKKEVGAWGINNYSGMYTDPPSPQPGLSVYIEYSTWRVPL